MEFSDYIETRLPADVLDGLEKLVISQNGESVECNINDLALFIAGVIGSSTSYTEWDNTLNKFPDPAQVGVIPRFKTFVGVGTGSWEIFAGQGAETVLDGTMFVALVSTPGQTPGNWRRI